MPATNCASALLFFQWRIGFTRRRLRFGALGFAQRSFLVSLSLFLLAASTCRPRSLGSISSVIYLKCHRLLAGWITHSSALYKHVAMPLQRHVCASNYNDGDNPDRMAARQERIDAFTHQGVPPADQPLELLCEDHVGTYVIPFLCRWSSGAWHSVHTSNPIEATVIGWRVR
jgi:hypothetical protein